jgi:hypothetical protein
MVYNVDVFKKYANNNFFIETGSYQGDGINSAIESGFKTIISIEITPQYYGLCKEKYKDNKGVIIVLGDSSKVLKNIINKINQPITFWLDAHHCSSTALYSKDAGWFALRQELEIIKQHHIKNHTILIDDWRCFDQSYSFFDKHNLSQQMIKNMILDINSDYKFAFDNGVIPNDILVATV